MARRKIPMNEVSEIIYRWHRGGTVSGIARGIGADPKTVRKYIRLGVRAGLARETPLPPDHEIAALLAPLKAEAARLIPAPGKERLAPYHEQLSRWAADENVTMAQMRRLLQEEHPELSIGYTCFCEYIQMHFRPRRSPLTVRLASTPGHQAQVDYAYVGRMVDPATGKPRKTWVFIMTLAHSRLMFVRFVFRQDAATWVDCHARAFEFFGGVPNTVVIDNLKAGVLAADLYDPTLNRLYQDCERHYGFVIDPARPYHPKDKPRVERAVQTVRGLLLAGRTFANIDDANARALLWCREEFAGRIHGTTKRSPRELFEAEERQVLLPLPTARFEPATWTTATVPFDHCVVFDGGLYSLPSRFVGKPVDVQGTPALVRIFHDGQLVKTHTRVPAGHAAIDPLDFPEGKRKALLGTAQACRERAAAIGAATLEVTIAVLDRDAWIHRRRAQALLRLADRHGQDALEAACRRALHFEAATLDTVKGILEKKLAFIPPDEPEVAPPPAGFARPASYFAHV